MSLHSSTSLLSIIVATLFLLNLSQVSAQETKKTPPQKNDPYFNAVKQASRQSNNQTLRPRKPASQRPAENQSNSQSPITSQKSVLPNSLPQFKEDSQNLPRVRQTMSLPAPQEKTFPNNTLQNSNTVPNFHPSTTTHQLKPRNRSFESTPVNSGFNNGLKPKPAQPSRQLQPQLRPPQQLPGSSASPSSGQFQPSANTKNPSSQFQNSNASFQQPTTPEKPSRLLRKVAAESPTMPQEKQQSPKQLSTYQNIEPDSVVSDANLSGENSIQKIAEKQSEEIFEPGKLMAVVGGEPIFAAHLTLEANQLIEKFMPTAPEKIKREQRKFVLEKLLNKYVETKLFYVDIVRGLPEGAKVKDIHKTLGEHFDKEVLSKILKKNEVKSANKFDIRLRSQGVSLRQFRARWIEDEFVRYFLKDKININPDVQHQEIIDYYRKNVETYKRKARARWEQIEIHFTQIPDRTKAKQAIARLGNEVVYGAPLPAVAKRGSHGLKAAGGGQEGWVTKGSLVSKKLDEAIFSLPLNRLSDIIETDLGYHIIRVLERTPAGVVPFSEAQIEIKKKLVEQKREEGFKKHLAKLRKEIPVEILIKPAKTAENKQGQIR